ncbi:DUF2953 domain-containing protein [Lentibacillus cibarius]|uniref:DUF2953 domain-containing protein n=1 Tax=Lentibacillus cibarius TaxID=2583219 RepID=A0A549YM62_9BACI|nr:DUF2953 domain-containing protein [Lentibacillus cibarius]
MIIGLIIIVFLIVCMILLYSNLKIVCSVTLNQEEQTLYLAVYLYRIRLMKRSIDLTEEPVPEQSFQETLTIIHKFSKNFSEKMKDVNTAVSVVLKRIRFHSISWKTDVGTGKADTTGMVTGGIWGMKGMVIGLLTSKSTLVTEPSVVVTPFFNQRKISSVFDCMITIRVGQAIYAFLKFIRKLPGKREAIT